jgi:hypothetical protein
VINYCCLSYIGKQCQHDVIIIALHFPHSIESVREHKKGGDFTASAKRTHKSSNSFRFNRPQLCRSDGEHWRDKSNLILHSHKSIEYLSTATARLLMILLLQFVYDGREAISSGFEMTADATKQNSWPVRTHEFLHQ